jgi:hypothetical protein
VQLLHLVLHLGQLGQGAGQRRVVLRAAQHGHALGEAGRVEGQLCRGGGGRERRR